MERIGNYNLHLQEYFKALQRLFRSQATMTKLLHVRKCIKLYLWFVKQQQQQQSLNTIYFQNKTDTEPVG